MTTAGMSDLPSAYGRRSLCAFVILCYLFPGPILRLLFGLRARGVHGASQGPVIFAGNHLSFLDPVFVQLMVRRRIVFLGKEEYFSGPGMKGWLVRGLLRATGLVIPVDRSGGVSSDMSIEAARAVLARDGAIGLFPEGTRSPDGRLYRGHTGVARLVSMTHAPVVPVAVLNSDRILPPGRLIPKIMRARIVIGQPIQFGRRGSDISEATYCRSVTDEIMAAIQALSGQEYVDIYAIAPVARVRMSGRLARSTATAIVAAGFWSRVRALAMLAPLLRSGVLEFRSPVRIAREVAELRRWGLGPAGGIRAAAARSPSRIAVIDQFGELSYRDLAARIWRLAQSLRDLNPTDAGDRVGVLCRNHRGAVEAMAAALTVGADAVLINTHLTLPQLAGLAREQQLSAIFHDAESKCLATAMPGRAPLLEVPPPEVPHAGSPHAHCGSQRPRPPARKGTAIVFTAGTTGAPKGAILRRPMGLATFAAMLSRIPIHAGDRMLIAVPLFGTFGHAALQAALGLRATVVLRPRFEAAEILRLVYTSGCEVLIVAPVMLQMLLEQPVRATRLRVVLSGGSPVPGDLATRFMDAYGDVLYNVYGSTEVSCASIATPAELRRAPDTAGRVPRGTVVAILDATGRPLPPDQTGRIFVRNDMLFSGYTSGASAAEMHYGLAFTGDLGHMSDDGLLFVDGRADDMIISGGENVFPGPVESVIGHMSQVREVAVVGAPDERFGQCLVAFVVLRAGETLHADQVRALVREKLPRSSVPRNVTFVKSLPRNAAGKVVARDLVAGDQAQ